MLLLFHVCSIFDAYVFSNEVLFALQDAPWSDANGADLPSGFGRVVLQSVSDVTYHSCIGNEINILGKLSLMV